MPKKEAWLTVYDGLDDILSALQEDRPVHLNKEQAIAYIVWYLRRTDGYPTGMQNEMPALYPQFTISDTILDAALTFLLRRGVVSDRREKTRDRGRPRRMFKLNAVTRSTELLAEYWVKFAGQPRSALAATDSRDNGGLKIESFEVLGVK